jgi:diguanylate cyclase (GGDEF)-like protein
MASQIRLALIVLASIMVAGLASAGGAYALALNLGGTGISLDGNGLGIQLDTPLIGVDVQAGTPNSTPSPETTPPPAPPPSTPAEQPPPAGQPASGQSSVPSAARDESAATPKRGSLPSTRPIADRTKPGSLRTSPRARVAAKGTTSSPAGTPVNPQSGDPSGAATKRTAAVQRNQPSALTRIVDRIPLWLILLAATSAAFATIFAAVWLRERQQRKTAVNDSLTDPLTGIANRKAFEQRIASEWSRVKRYGGTLGVLMIDVDDFKQINDRHGHEVGDRTLKSVADWLVSSTRATDTVARIGGDEFAVLCPETPTAGLTRMRAEIANVKDEPDTPRLSIGFAQSEAGDVAFRDVIIRADASMYADKTGRARRLSDGGGFSPRQSGTQLSG